MITVMGSSGPVQLLPAFAVHRVRAADAVQRRSRGAASHARSVSATLATADAEYTRLLNLLTTAAKGGIEEHGAARDLQAADDE